MMVGAAPPFNCLFTLQTFNFACNLYIFSQVNLFLFHAKNKIKYILNEDYSIMEYSTAVSMQLKHPSFT